MRDVRWASKLLAYKHTLSWFVSSYKTDGVSLLKLAAERQSWKVAKALLVAIWRWHRQSAMAASPEAISAMVSLIEFGVRPGRVLNYLHEAGDEGAGLIIRFAPLIGLTPSHFASERSLESHFRKHGGAATVEGYLGLASETVSNPSARLFLAYHLIHGWPFPRMCFFAPGKQMFVSVNGGGCFSTCFHIKKSTLRSLLSDKQNITRPFVLR